jgi:hypothetical protein
VLVRRHLRARRHDPESRGQERERQHEYQSPHCPAFR